MAHNLGSIDRTRLFTEHFKDIEDSRRTHKGNFLHPLMDILLLVVSGVVSGADDRETVVLFGENQLDWLRRQSPFSNGVPSPDMLKKGLFGP